MSSTHLPQISIDLNAHVKQTCKQHVTVLFKEVLGMFEQLAEENDEALDKLYEALPPEYKPYVELANHYTEEKFDRIRRAVLTRGNDAHRAIADELDKYNLTLRNP